MVATIRYTDCMLDKKVVFGVLSQLNAHVLWTQTVSAGIQYKIKLQVESVDELNQILTVLNKNTTYGVEYLSCKPTFGEVLAGLFKEKKKNDW